MGKGIGPFFTDIGVSTAELGFVVLFKLGFVVFWVPLELWFAIEWIVWHPVRIPAMVSKAALVQTK